MVLTDVVYAVRYWTNFSTSRFTGVRVIVVRNRRVLLVSHWYAPWAWTLPGGGIDKGESPEDAAMREVYEETGFKVHSLGGKIGEYRGRWGRGDIVCVFFTGDIEGSLAMKPNLEIMARSWFDLDQLPAELSPANRRRIEAYKAGVRGEEANW